MSLFFFFLMIRPPPRFTRSAPLFPYPPLFRSPAHLRHAQARRPVAGLGRRLRGAAARMSDGSASGEATIVGAEIVAGHDGSAELVVRLRHPNGAEGPIVPDEATGLKLTKNCGASAVEDRHGPARRRIVGGGLVYQVVCGGGCGERA